MPTFDGGHAFFTALIPVRTDPVEREDGPPQDRIAALREELSLLPIAKQSPASDRADLPVSPFAKVPTTHFVRLVVIDDAVFNGRDPQDALSNAGFGPDLTVPVHPADHLPNAYLFFSADIDAPDETASEIDAWLKAVWAAAEPEMRAIFQHCVDFQTVASADRFAGYVRRGEVETTMSFNDYFEGPPPLKAANFGPHLIPAGFGALVAALGIGGLANLLTAAVFGDVLGPLIVLAGVALYGALTYRAWSAGRPIFSRTVLSALGVVVAAAKGVMALFRLIPFLPEPGLVLSGWAIFLGVPTLLAGTAYFVWWVDKTGSKSLPTAPNSDLKSVLKALHLQRRFTDFAIANQGSDPNALHKAFGDFLKAEKPSNVDAPTQPPGVIGRAPKAGAA